jgi:hypothetical protein
MALVQGMAPEVQAAPVRLAVMAEIIPGPQVHLLQAVVMDLARVMAVTETIPGLRELPRPVADTVPDLALNLVTEVIMGQVRTAAQAVLAEEADLARAAVTLAVMEELAPAVDQEESISLFLIA